VVFDPSEDRAAVLKRYRAGEFDVVRDLPDDQLGWLRQNMPRELHIAPYAGVYYYAMNTTKPPFNDKRVRVSPSRRGSLASVLSPRPLQRGDNNAVVDRQGR
jgi:oligopeptide transport system substrate-binding protein